MEDYLSDWDATSETLTSTFFFLDRELRDLIVFCRELRESATLRSSSAFLSLLELLLSDSSSNSLSDYSRSLVVNEFVSDFFDSSWCELLFLLLKVSIGWILNFFIPTTGAAPSFYSLLFLVADTSERSTLNSVTSVTSVMTCLCKFPSLFCSSDSVYSLATDSKEEDLREDV